MHGHKYVYNDKFWTPSPTLSDENSFFHSAFGTRLNEVEAYSDEKTRLRRKRWSIFLSHFETESIPPSLADVLTKCFSAHDKYRDVSFEDKSNLANYADDVMSADVNVTVEEIPVLATLSNMKIVLFKSQEKDPLVVEPDTELLGTYLNNPEEYKDVVLLLEGNAYSRLNPSSESFVPKFDNTIKLNVTQPGDPCTTFERSGSAGSKAVEFQMNLLVLFLLNVHQNLSDWRLSAINKKAAAFGDVVLEYSDGAILLQAKYKENEMGKITMQDLFSDNPKSDGFSLPKYFLSYHREVNKNFHTIKNVIICTNKSFDSDTSKFLNTEKICPNNILYHKDNDYFFLTLKENMLTDLKESVKGYHVKLKEAKRHKTNDETVITDENLKQFMKHLRLYPKYPAGNDLRQVIEQLLFSHNSLRGQTYLEICEKIKQWYKLKKSPYLTKTLTDVMILEIQRDKSWQMLERYEIYFERNNFIQLIKQKNKQIYTFFEDEYLLPLLKVHDALKNDKEQILYVNSDDEEEAQKQVIEAFALPRYIFLIIVCPKIIKFTKQMFQRLESILAERNYKKIIIISVSLNKNEFISKMQLGISTFFKSYVKLIDLSEDSLERLFKKKGIIFQGADISIEELFTTHTFVAHNMDLTSELLDMLIRGKKIRVGVPVTGLDDHITRFYIDRQFQRKIIDHERGNTEGSTFGETLSEDDIVKASEKLILISDIAGMGKSTVLTNLAAKIKKSNPNLWVVRIELNNYAEDLDRFNNIHHRLFTVKVLLAAKGTNMIEDHVLLLPEKIVLMLDGFDEISPDYTDLIINMLIECRNETSIAKIFVTTRPHMIQELELKLKVKGIMLQPFTENDQIKFLTSYWMYALQLVDRHKEKCERYANMLINKMPVWMKPYHHVECNFIEVPLQAKMFAEVFQENNEPEKTDWKGCKEYISVSEIDPKFPDKMNILELYKMFIEKKLEIFTSKANPTKNVFSRNLLIKEFNDCLSYHQSLSLKVIFGDAKCRVFSTYRDISQNAQSSMLSIGIVQKVNKDLQFVHRTFAEYFVIECLLTELNLQNEKFCSIFKDILLNPHFVVIRAFLNSYLEEDSTVFSKLSSYNYWFFTSDRQLPEMKHKSYLIHLLAEEGCLEILRLLCPSTNFIIDTEINIENESDRTPLYYAAKHNHLPMAQFLVDRGADVNIHRGIYSSPLVAAVREGNFGMVQFLMQQKTNITVKGWTGYYILYDAIVRKHVTIAEYLFLHVMQNDGLNVDVTLAYTAAYLGRSEVLVSMIDRGLDTNGVTETGETLIFGATRGGHLDIIEYLEKQGTKINAKDNYDNTALHIATLEPSLAFVAQLLIELGIDLDVENRFGRTALHNAVKSGTFDVVELLIKHRANIKSKDKSGESPFHVIASSDHVYLRDDNGRTLLHAFAELGELEMVESLERLGMDMNVRDSDGRTPLYVAILCGNFDVVEFLVGHGVSVNIGDICGRTPLQLLASSGHSNLVELLLKHGVYVNDRNDHCGTALHEAASKGYLDIVKLLVERESNVNVREKSGQTPLHYAASEGRSDVVEYLVEHGATVDIRDNKGRTAVFLAAERSNFDTVRFLVEHGAYVDIKDDKGQTPLYFAAERGDSRTVKFLVEHGADVNVQDYMGVTVLYFAARKCDFDTVKFLVEHKANVDVKNYIGRTVLHFAAETGYSDALRLLVDHGANADVTDNNGHTALHFAVKSRNSDTARLLVDHGADVNIKNNRGETALHLADCDSDIVQLLTKHGGTVDTALMP